MTDAEKQELAALRSMKVSADEQAELESLRAQKAAAVPETSELVEKNFNPSPLDTYLLKTTNPLGFGDELVGAGKAISDAPSIIKDKGLSLDAIRGIRDSYRKNRDEAREAFDLAAKKNPKAAIAGDITQGLGLGAMTGGVGTAKQAAALGAAYGFGNSKADLTKGDVLGGAADTALGAGTGAIMSKIPARTTLGGIAGYLATRNSDDATKAKGIIGGAGAATVAPWLVKKGFSQLLGVNPEAVSDYVKRSEEINKSPTKSMIREKLDAFTTMLRDKADEAKDMLDKARGQKVAHVADDVQGSLEDLKGKVVSGSKAAVETIKNATDENGVPMPGMIKVKTLKQQLTNQMRRLQPLGPEAGAPPGAAQASLGRLQAWRDWVDQLPQYITNEQAKKVIQRLDQASKEFYGRGAGEFAPEEQVALAKVRQGIDVKLKRSLPEYAEAMQPVSENAKLLSESRNAFPERGTVSRLQNLESPQNATTKDVLGRLGKATGKNFEQGLSAAPEEAAYTAAEAQANAVRPITPRTSGQSSTENFLNRITGGKVAPTDPTLNDQDLMTTLTTHMPELPGQIKNAKTLNAFTGQRTNGSRNAVTFGAAGTAIAHQLGMSHTMGAAAGASIGHTVDTYGPRMAKGILDKAVIPAKQMAEGVIQKLSSSPQGQSFISVLQKTKNPADFASKYFLMSQQFPAFRGALEEKE